MCIFTSYVAMLYKLIAFKGHLWDCLGIFRESYWDTFRQIFMLSLINQTVGILSDWEMFTKFRMATTLCRLCLMMWQSIQLSGGDCFYWVGNQSLCMQIHVSNENLIAIVLLVHSIWFINNTVKFSIWLSLNVVA